MTSATQPGPGWPAIGLIPALALGALVALGLGAAGWFIGSGLYEARASERYVTVRGFAEREVPADLAIWPIVFTATADELGELQRQVDASAATVRAFLAGRFAEDGISVSAPRVTDREAQGMYGGDGRPLARYAAEVTVILRTGDIEELRRAMAGSGELVKQGVAVIRSWEFQTQYVYTGLEQVKPDMIAEATRDARRAAEQFAADSGSRVGGIRNAQQGLFSIEDRDPFSPEFKKIRVVTTVQYLLESP